MEQLIEARLEERSAQGIVVAIGSLITEGQIAAGNKLPTVRALAARLGMSANTVSDAWRILQSHGTINTDRRRGTTVRSTRVGVGGRHWQVPVAPGTIELDLSTGTPDRSLLPPLGPVLHQIHANVSITSYLDPPVVVALEKELRRRAPFESEEITVVDGAQDALDRVIGELVGVGDAVVVEDPTFPPVLDMLELAGARVIGVPLDQDGAAIDAVRHAMAFNPAAIITQPRANNPTGIHTSAARARAIAGLVKGTRTMVVEDDHSAGATGLPIHSVGRHVPDHTIYIHSFSKSYGPDLRIAAIGGPAAAIANIVRRRQLGPSWTSRLIQEILLAMLTDPSTQDLVASAAESYQERRVRFELLLARHGLTPTPGAGLNMWIPVENEHRAVVSLAAHGIGVAPGAPFRASLTDEHHIRVSLGSLDRDFERVASAIAAAARGPGPTSSW